MEPSASNAATTVKQEAIEASVAASASKLTYGGAATVGLGWLLSSEGAVLVGMIVGVAGFIVNFYYKHKEDRRQERAAKLNEELLQSKIAEYRSDY